MKKFMAIMLVLALMLCSAGCGSIGGKTPDEKPVVCDGETIGEGSKTFAAQIVDLDGSQISFTVKTDKTVVGEALQELGVLKGEEGPYGLYIKKVNGIVADYDIDATYWSLSKGGEMLMTGADTTNITDGETYELTRAK